MADRTQNINIKYNSDYTQIEKSEAILHRAQAATNSLRTSTQQFSQQASQGYKFASKSIEGMEAELVRLRQQLKLASTEDKARLEKLRQDYKSAKQQVDALNKSLLNTGHAAKVATTEAKDLSMSFGQMYQAIRLVMTAGILKEVVDLSLRMATLAGNVEGVSRAFDRLPNSTLLLHELKAATHGAVGDLELMQKALMASNYKIPLEQLGTLLEFAATKAQQTGQEVNHLVDYIVTGIGLRSIKRLDDLGFTAARVRDALGGVSLQAASMGEVSAAVAKLMNEDLQKLGGYAETSATKVEQLKVEFTELQIAIAQSFSGENERNISFFTKSIEGLKNIVKAYKFEWTDLIGLYGAITAVQRTQAGLTKAAKEESIALLAAETALQVQRSAATMDQQKRTDFVQQEINSRVQLIGRYNDEIKKLEEISKLGKGFGFPGFKDENPDGFKRFQELQKQFGAEAKEIFDNEIRSARESLSAWKLNKEVIQETIKLLAEYLLSIEAQNIVDAEQLGLIEAKRKEIEALQEQLEKAGSKNEISKLNHDLVIAQAQLNDLLKLGIKEFEGVEKAGKVIKKIEKDFKETNLAAPFLDAEAAFKRLEQSLLNFKGIKPPEFTPMDFMDHLEKAVKESKEIMIGSGLDIMSEQIKANQEIELQGMQNQLTSLREYYDEQMILADDNERAKKLLKLKEERDTNEIRRRIAMKEKESRKFSIVIDTAAAIIKAFATMPTPAAIVQSAIIAALGASQLAVVNRTPVPKFAKGVIDLKAPGTRGVDSVHAMIAPGESVMTADETMRAKGIFHDVKAKKLDDRMLRQLQVGSRGGYVINIDTKEVVQAINRQKYPDIIQQGGMLYEVRRKTDTLTQKVRSKSMSI